MTAPATSWQFLKDLYQEAEQDDILNGAAVLGFDMFTGVVQEITQEQRGGLLSFGLLAALWATSTGMYAIMQQLNITYGVQERRGFLQARLVAISLSLLFVVLVLGGFSLIVLGGQIQQWLGARFGIGDASMCSWNGVPSEAD